MGPAAHKGAKGPKEQRDHMGPRGHLGPCGHMGLRGPMGPRGREGWGTCPHRVAAASLKDDSGLRRFVF